jgi:hypothetical protein
LVSDIKGRLYIQDISEQGAVENIWTEERWIGKEVEENFIMRSFINYTHQI